MDSFSEFAGYASIACWLGAQLPQVIKNHKAQSSEGIALPFLANWLAGDVSNLIGCLLTHQLPFQKWLATYFCFVDMMLVVQYFYYGAHKPLALPHGHSRLRAASSAARRKSVERPHSHYRTLSVVAANVAVNAALAAQQDAQSHARLPRRSLDQSRDLSSRRFSREVTGVEDDIDDPDLAAMTDSFHSEGGRTSRRKLVSWSRERYGSGRPTRGGQIPPTSPIHPSLQITSHDPRRTGDAMILDRGRPRQREGDQSDDDAEQEEWNQSTAASTVRTSSRASRRGASLVFLGVWVLFGVGTLAGKRSGFSSGTAASIGRVLTRRLPAVETSALVTIFGQDIEDPSSVHLLGRIFAWLCTTLYLTSRLPQIWKNFVRKSVEGLSMYLFVFAFLANVCYVTAILTAPGMRLPTSEREAFIRESIPYLLGSAGTLIFDITIVSQSFIYVPKGPRHRGRQGSVAQIRTANEEEAGLLHGDALAASTHIEESSDA